VQGYLRFVDIVMKSRLDNRHVMGGVFLQLAHEAEVIAKFKKDRKLLWELND
jgi:hypothetical protein